MKISPSSQKMLSVLYLLIFCCTRQSLKSGVFFSVKSEELISFSAHAFDSNLQKTQVIPSPGAQFFYVCSLGRVKE